MKELRCRWPALLAALLALPLAAVSGRAQTPEQPSPAPKDAPETVWPATLERIAGKYRFIQIASPGGLWEKTRRGDMMEKQQVAFNQLPKALREQLEKAEIQILDLEAPTTKQASVQKSPGVGGMLRHYTEEARGKLVMRGLPGIGAIQDDPGAHEGEVIFGLAHTSLSNPSVSGVFLTRLKSEVTWGPATLDFADLTAMKPSKERKEGEEPEYPIFNARILRSGLEIFAYIQWNDAEALGKGDLHEITGSVRLIRISDEQPPQ